ncbi:MAG: class I SAM-dependent RNA methyltransferase [Clostridia bacterium]|nr:class I SAM-dependent RNA methyltransferase [Clostridia bacterium]
MTEYEYVATCLFGLERFVGEEIEALGYTRVDTMDGRVTFRGDISAIARCNMWLRCAERIYLKMGSFRAETFTELFDGTRALPWEEWIGRDDAFPVKGHSVRSLLASIPDCQSIIKKAIVERMKDEHGLSIFPEEGVKYQIDFFIFNNTATLMIDTSGAPLFKRGYRPVSGAAPLRETLACAMVKLSRPRENVLLWDPMCGSGTIPIEAALLMTDTAPGSFRSFVSEDFFDIPPSVWKEAREEARDLVKATEFRAYASDIDPAMVDLTKENLRRAGMESIVKCFVKDARTVAAGGMRGTVVCNPPYGERLMDIQSARALYRELGRTFSALDRWQIYILTSDEEFERHYGKRADKVRKLYNGMIKCGYYQFFKSQSAK